MFGGNIGAARRVEPAMWIEVETMFGGTTLDVAHLRPAAARRGLAALGLGAALCVGGLALFVSEVRQDWTAHAAAVAEAQVRGEVRPPPPGRGTGGLGGALALLGLVPLVVGAMRLREPSPARLHSLDPESTPTFVAGATGTWICTADARRLVPTAGCRIEHAGLTLAVRAVAPETASIARGRLDLPLRSLAGSALALLGLFAVLSHMPPELDASRHLELWRDSEQYVGRVVRASLPPVDPRLEAGDDADAGAGNMSGESGVVEGSRAARPRSRAAQGPARTVPALDRGYDPERAARSAGVLAMLRPDTFIAPGGEGYAEADGDADVWAGGHGAAVGEIGLGGLGLVGTGRGGPLSGEVAALGVVGLTGKGGGGGTCGCGKGSPGSPAFGGRGSRVPTVRQGQGQAQGALDGEVIRRIVRAHLNEVRYCYNQALARDPGEKGRVAVQFVIGGAGQVSSAMVGESDVDPALAACVTQAVRRWKFPRGEGAGSTMVNYPFVFAPA